MMMTICAIMASFGTGRAGACRPFMTSCPRPQVGLDRRLVLGVGAEGRQATLANALSQVAQFDLSQDDARAIVTDMADRVHARWQACFAEANVHAADQGRFATCFRLADPGHRAMG